MSPRLVLTSTIVAKLVCGMRVATQSNDEAIRDRSEFLECILSLYCGFRGFDRSERLYTGRHLRKGSVPYTLCVMVSSPCGKDRDFEGAACQVRRERQGVAGLFRSGCYAWRQHCPGGSAQLCGACGRGTGSVSVSGIVVREWAFCSIDKYGER